MGLYTAMAMGNQIQTGTFQSHKGEKTNWDWLQQSGWRYKKSEANFPAVNLRL
jgi:hypothetical protein